MSQAPVVSANSVLLTQNPGTLPDMNDSIKEWFQPMTFEVLTKTVVNFQVVETPSTTSFQGIWQPFSPKELKILPQGERDWSWFKLHADPSLALNPDDVVQYQSVQYRVMSKLDYTNYGFIEYSLVQDYTGSGP